MESRTQLKTVKITLNIFAVYGCFAKRKKKSKKVSKFQSGIFVFWLQWHPGFQALIVAYPSKENPKNIEHFWFRGVLN